MDATRYTQLATQTLEALFEAIEEADAAGDFDTEYHDGVLTVILPSGQTFVINRHEPTRQVWVSSPVSGAHYFRFDDATARWRENGVALEDLILGELRRHAGHA